MTQSALDLGRMDAVEGRRRRSAAPSHRPRDPAAARRDHRARAPGCRSTRRRTTSTATSSTCARCWRQREPADGERACRRVSDAVDAPSSPRASKAASVAHSHGLSIYFPKRQISPLYGTLDFTKISAWDEFVAPTLRRCAADVAPVSRDGGRRSVTTRPSPPSRRRSACPANARRTGWRRGRRRPAGLTGGTYESAAPRGWAAPAGASSRSRSLRPPCRSCRSVGRPRRPRCRSRRQAGRRVRPARCVTIGPHVLTLRRLLHFHEPRSRIAWANRTFAFGAYRRTSGVGAFRQPSRKRVVLHSAASRSTNTCSRRRSAERVEARTAAGLGRLVSRDLPGRVLGAGPRPH